MKCNYKDGKPDGSWNFMMKSLTYSNPEWKDGKLEARHTYYKNGQLKDKYYNKNGEIDDLETIP